MLKQFILNLLKGVIKKKLKVQFKVVIMNKVNVFCM